MATAARIVRAPLSALSRYAEISLFLLLVNSVLALVWTGKLDPLSTVLAPTALGFKAWRYWRGSGPELSARTATWLVLAYLPLFPLDLLFFSRALAGGSANAWLYAALYSSVHLMLFVLVVRLYSATSTRDQLFLTMMAAAALLAAAIFTVDTAFLAFLLAFLVLGVSTFMGLEMRRSAEGAVAPPLEARTPAASRLNRALGITAVALTAGAALVGAAIFVVLPRFPAGYLGGLTFNPTLISGFSDNVELGRIGEIKLNSAVVMRTRMDVKSEGAPNLHWRGIALTTFDGHRWFTEEHEATPTLPDSEGWFPILKARPTGGQNHYRAVHYTVLLEPLATDALFVLTHPIAVRGNFLPDAERRPREVRRSYLLVDKTNSLFNPYNNFSKTAYEGLALVPMLPPDALRSSGTTYPPEIRETYLQLPPLDERIPRLARQITGRATTPFDKAAAIELYLRTRYGYTLQQPEPPPADPLAHFLFRRQAGHCEYFATAMTVMVRSLGIPARYVNGFLPGEYNDVADSYIVRASDAHSWVEVYFPDYGWIPFDPTPPAGQRPRFFLGRLAYYWDWFELAWSEWVVNFSSQQQLTLFVNASRASRQWSASLRGFIAAKNRAVVDWLKHIHFLTRKAVRRRPLTLLVPALLLALVLLVLLRGRALAELFAELAARTGLGIGGAAVSVPRLATIYYARMLRLLERRGFRKGPAQTPLEFAAALPGSELSAQVSRMTAIYQAARFGASTADAKEMSRQIGAISAFLRTPPREH